MSELTEFVDKNPCTTFFILLIIEESIANICNTIIALKRKRDN